MKTLNFEEPLDIYPATEKPVYIESRTPVNTLGQLRDILKDLPDDTVISNGIVPLVPEGYSNSLGNVRRAHRVLCVRKGMLKNGKPYICLMSGEDITQKVWKFGGMKLD